MIADFRFPISDLSRVGLRLQTIGSLLPRCLKSAIGNRQSAIALLCLAALCGRGLRAAEPAPAKEQEPTAAARAIATLEGRLAELHKEGTGLALRERYEALQADAAAVLEAHPADPASVRAHWLIARCCEALGKHPEKEAAFERYIDALFAAAKDRAAAELRSEIEALVARRELFAATKLLRLMLAKFPDGSEAAWALYRLGACYLLMDHFADAATAFGEVLERWPDGPAAVQARLRIARANLAQRKAADTAASLADFLAKHPDPPMRDALLFDLATAHYLARDYYNALVAFQRLVREAPSSPYVPIARAAVAKLRADTLNRLSLRERDNDR
ncbi:MAG: tetratricopeptide repeat protein [Planctomycetes bacterium]|nr:tetratricopeptide repeat protein [Planctomycetota bacterium]